MEEFEHKSISRKSPPLNCCFVKGIIKSFLLSLILNKIVTNVVVNVYTLLYCGDILLGCGLRFSTVKAINDCIVMFMLF